MNSFIKQNEQFKKLYHEVNSANQLAHLQLTFDAINSITGSKVECVDDMDSFLKIMDVENLKEGQPLVKCESGILIVDNFNYNKTYVIDLLYEALDALNKDEDKNGKYKRALSIIKNGKIYYCDNALLHRYLFERKILVPFLESTLIKYEDEIFKPSIFVMKKEGNMINVLSEREMNVINIFDIINILCDYTGEDLNM